jgi:diguanylate cyclase (GGDEF)-like protein
VNDGAGEQPLQKRFVRADGSVVEVVITSTLIDDDQRGQLYFSQVQDVTHASRAHRQQAAIAELGHLALELTDVEILFKRAVRVVGDTLGVDDCSIVIFDQSDRVLRLEASTDPGTAASDVPGGNGSQCGYTLMSDGPVICNDINRETRFSVPADLMTDGIQRGVSVPIRARRVEPRVLIAHERKGGREFVEEDVPFMESVANVLASALDRVAAEAELRRRALEDPLTGLANRALLGSHLERAVHSNARNQEQIAVMMLDLDRFKYLNDTLGHSAGDELLVAVAARLTTAVREADLVARLGGDEFVVVCSDAGTDAAIAEIAQRVVDVLAEPFGVGERELFVSASVGVAVVGPDGRATAESLLRDADAAMYRAKERGGARYEVFDAELRARLVRRVSTEEALRGALERNELRVRYQPIVRPQTGQVSAFEALLRWSHPERGVVSPAEFIPVAEETDLIIPIGAWVLRTACEQASVWNAQRGPSDPLALSVNLSPRQVRPELIEEVRRALDGTIHPRLLVLEITESLLLEPVATSDVITELRALGVRVALDDFGSGYSSLSYLQSYPLDFVKLDRGFVQTLDDSEATGAVVRAAIQMAAALGLRIVAEGVQRPEQLARLRELGCDYAQGFLFAPALEPDEAVGVLGGFDLTALVEPPAVIDVPERLASITPPVA